MLKALPATPVDPLFATANPTDGDVEAAVDASSYDSIDAEVAQFVTKTISAPLRRGHYGATGIFPYCYAEVQFVQPLGWKAILPKLTA